MDILGSIKNVIENSSSVQIDLDKLKNYCARLIKIEKTHWLYSSPCKINVEDLDKKLNLFFLIDLISFCYWQEPKWQYKYNNVYDGTWGLICAINKAIDSGFSLYDYEYLDTLSFNEFEKLFYYKSSLPMVQERYEIVKNIAKIIKKEYNGLVRNIIEQNKDNAITLLEQIVKSFQYFEDYSFFNNEKVLFYKKAQLTVSDLTYEVRDTPYKVTSGIEKLTACADYKLPYVLNNYGILIYSKPLQQKITDKVEIIENSAEEVEIRANTIWAIELIKEELNQKGLDLTSMQINDYLWLLSQKKNNFKLNYHRTKTCKY